MCGIWGYISLKDKHDVLKLFSSFMQVQKRGPDRSDFKAINEFIKVYLGFHRLAIMDRSTYGDQPFTLELKTDSNESSLSTHRSIYAICNGEIYNFRELIEENKFGSSLKSHSDCEFIPLMYAKYGFEDMLKKLRGEFAICVMDIDHINEKISISLGRDQTAVRPIFIGNDDDGIAFGSILKGIVDIVSPKSIRQVKRAEFITINLSKNQNDIKYEIISKIYHKLDELGVDLRFKPKGQIQISGTDEKVMFNQKDIPSSVFNIIRSKFIEAVECRLESDRPIGALLSGGLDSSLVVSIAAAHLRKSGRILKTFSIGIPGSTDREYAEMVAKHCGTEHKHIEFSEEKFLDAIPEVVQAIESYDTTSVRASVGQYLISKWIKQNTDIRVLLIGDGSDELCSGYMYFHNAPDAYTSHKENVRLVEDIQYYDALRADRCIAYNGIEARVPFLDHQFVDLYLSLPYEYRVPLQEGGTGRKIEKWLLRKSFDVKHNVDYVLSPYLPSAVLWRKKEAFSDGVSSKQKSWYQIIQENVEKLYDETNFKDPDVNIHLKPLTKEALHYRRLFNNYFHPKASGVIPYYWMPKWSGNITDPSARVLKVYDS